MVHELRIYTIKKGGMARWAALMEEMIIPFQQSMGMEILERYTGLGDDGDRYIWLRRFKDEAERRELYDRVYGSDYWKETVRPAMGDLMVREEKQEIVMTPVMV